MRREEAAAANHQSSIFQSSNGVGGEERREGEEVSFAGMFRLVLVYCFSDAAAGGWELPVFRALAIVRNFFYGEFSAYAGKALRYREVFARPVFGLDEFARLMAEEACAARYLRQVMRYVLPKQQGKDLNVELGKRLFLLAKAWLPLGVSDEQLSRDKVRWVAHEMGYEDLAVVFGEMPAEASDKERGRARARWCALKDRLIEKPVREAGERIDLHFSKSASVRERYRAAQMGNSNRKGKSAK